MKQERMKKISSGNCYSFNAINWDFHRFDFQSKSRKISIWKLFFVELVLNRVQIWDRNKKAENAKMTSDSLFYVRKIWAISKKVFTRLKRVQKNILVLFPISFFFGTDEFSRFLAQSDCETSQIPIETETIKTIRVNMTGNKSIQMNNKNNTETRKGKGKGK